jgi:hypothetical protein
MAHHIQPDFFFASTTPDANTPRFLIVRLTFLLYSLVGSVGAMIRQPWSQLLGIIVDLFWSRPRKQRERTCDQAKLRNRTRESRATTPPHCDLTGHPGLRNPNPSLAPSCRQLQYRKPLPPYLMTTLTISSSLQRYWRQRRPASSSAQPTASRPYRRTVILP